MLSKKSVGTSLLLICLVCSQAQPPKHTGRFNPVIDDNINGFWEYLPRNYSIDVTKRYPLLVFFHGSGEQGQVQDMTTLNLVLRNGPPKLIQSGTFPDSFFVQGRWYKFIVISPQIKIGLYGASSIVTPATVEAVIRYAKSEYRVDTSRIYLTGLSMGGGATWDYAGSSLDAASRLAGIVVACGAADLSMDEASNIARANLPVLATHNWDDPMVAASRTQANIASILSFNPSIQPMPKSIFWTTGGHNAWRRTFENIAAGSTPGGNVTDSIGMNVYQWMLQFTRLQVALPVSWENFSIQKKDELVLLEWQLGVQESIKEYRIERSRDARTWDVIGKMPANQQRRQVEYTYMDNHPEFGKSYYRLVAVDLNGTYNYSQTKDIYLQRFSYALHIYPNPFRESLSLDLTNNETSVTVRISDAMGKLVSNRQLAVANHSTRLDGISGLPSGIYYLSVLSRGEMLVHEKIIKE